MSLLTPCGHTKCQPCTMGGYESRDMARLTSFMDGISIDVLQAGCFIDAGAHVGMWSLVISQKLIRMGIQPQIYAVEPVAVTYRTLLKNAQRNPESGIIPVQGALWSEDDYLILEAGGIPARCWVHPDGGAFFDKNTPRTQAVAIDTLAIRGHNACWGMKIDVEGAELKVLQGARQMLLDNKVMYCVIEYNCAHFKRYTYTHREVNNFMEHHGFHCASDADKQAASKPPTTKSIVNVHWVKGI